MASVAVDLHVFIWLCCHYCKQRSECVVFLSTFLKVHTVRMLVSKLQECDQKVFNDHCRVYRVQGTMHNHKYQNPTSDATDKETVDVDLYFFQGHVPHMLQPSELPIPSVQHSSKTKEKGGKRKKGKPKRRKGLFFLVGGKQRKTR